MFYSALPFPLSPPSLSHSKNEYVRTKSTLSNMKYHQHSAHTSRTHTHTHSMKSQTHAKLGRGKLECWNRTFCYSKNTYEGTCGWEHGAHFLFTYTHTHIYVGAHRHTLITQQAGGGTHTHAHLHEYTHKPVCIRRDKHREHGSVLHAKRCDSFWKLSGIWVVVVFLIQGLWLKVIRNEAPPLFPSRLRLWAAPWCVTECVCVCVCVQSEGEQESCLSREPVL